jgi:hypothetical protein
MRVGSLWKEYFKLETYLLPGKLWTIEINNLRGFNGGKSLWIRACF